MKIGILACFLLAAVVGSGHVAAGVVRPDGEKNHGAERFVRECLGKGKTAPISFLYDGKPSASFLPLWTFAEERRRIDENRTERILSYTDPRTGLAIRLIVTVYDDDPAVEWVVKFKNTSLVNTPIIEAVKAVDTEFTRLNRGDFFLHRALGSHAAANDFAPIDDPILPGPGIAFGPTEGRSSGNGAMPFFNIEAAGEGMVVAIGWSGKWEARVQKTAENALRLAAGMEKTRFTLYPGEEVRTPRIALLFWSGGDRMTGHNLFRRFVLRYHTPQRDGKPVQLPLASPSGQGGPFPCNENSCTTEAYAIAMLQRYAQFGIAPEVWWIDAGWYEGSEVSWARGVGNWVVNRKNFPNGLRPVADAAKKLDMGFCLWFEPERVFRGTRLDREHPEWLIRLPSSPSTDNSLLDLGNPAARRWLTEYISGMIDREGITVYRQDFNFDPQEYWRAADPPDRQGISEIRHIEGLYAFWDELRKRHPDLLIDNCASGGRRLDLETISRSVPLWRTDYPFTANSQSHTYGIHFYLPANGTGNIAADTYAFRSSMSSALIYNWNLLNDFPLNRAVILLAEYKRLRPYFYGDYYPLTGYSVADDVWMAYQFHRPESGDGMVLAFRRGACPTAVCHVTLHGLSPAAPYEIRFEDYGLTTIEPGKTLGTRGMDIRIPEPGGSLLILYRQLPSAQGRKK
jgi:alpha-galactosidase